MSSATYFALIAPMLLALLAWYITKPKKPHQKNRHA